MEVETARVIEGYLPSSVDEKAAGFAKKMALCCGPTSPQRAKALLFACSKLADYGGRVGLESEAEVLLSSSVIERFIACSPYSGETRRTLRTNLRHVARAVLKGQAQPARLPRARAKAPYSRLEIAAYLALADAQPTTRRRLRTFGLICLGAGGGLMGDELRHVRGADVTTVAGGVVVTVFGRRGRIVPVLERYHDRLKEAAAAAGSGLILGGRCSDPNVVSRLTASLSGGEELSRIDTGRLRATWLTEVGSAMGLRAFMEAAGATCSQRLGELMNFMDELCRDEAIALLSGGRR